MAQTDGRFAQQTTDHDHALAVVLQERDAALQAAEAARADQVRAELAAKRLAEQSKDAHEASSAHEISVLQVSVRTRDEAIARLQRDLKEATLSAQSVAARYQSQMVRGTSLYLFLLNGFSVGSAGSG